ncbi:unnamed protein product [Psylliodes chrysocephalus]|uniref:Uncharacterized protein n=1 Tax=Psylliodes chrysocephalus TaxID=3402493 RepID=A0A9P0CGN3_9CUCU|nr:unnamed protein product [Psylliodes chrysocephala]
MNIGNIFTFSNSELVFFLQKIGQHEASKVTQKYNMDGKMFLSFSKIQSQRGFTDVEKQILWRCIRLIQMNPLSSVTISPTKEENNFSENAGNQLNDKLNNLPDQRTQGPFNDKADPYVKFENIPGHSRKNYSSTNFSRIKSEFTFKHLPEYAECCNRSLNSKPRLSTTSSGYMRPNTTIFLPRHEQITVDRIKKYASSEIINTSQENAYDAIIPPRIIIHTEEGNNQNQSNKSNSVWCDFLLSICCISCSVICKRTK